MFDDRRENGIMGFLDSVFDIIGQLLRIFIWIPITWVASVIAHFVKDVATGVYGKVVQATVVVVFGAIVYFFQTHMK